MQGAGLGVLPRTWETEAHALCSGGLALGRPPGPPGQPVCWGGHDPRGNHSWGPPQESGLSAASGTLAIMWHSVEETKASECV